MVKINTLLLFMILISGLACEEQTKTKPTLPKPPEKPTVSFTFDDGITKDIATYKFEDWNSMILQSLEEANLKATITKYRKNVE